MPANPEILTEIQPASDSSTTGLLTKDCKPSVKRGGEGSYSVRLAVLPDALVVVVHRDREGLLGPVLADDVLVELVPDLAGAGVLGALGRLFLGDDVVAQRDTLVADEHARARDELAHLAAALPTEGAVEVVHQARVLHQGPATPSARSVFA